MTHLEEGRLRALLDEELPEAEAQEIRAHLGSCLACDSAVRRAEETQVLTTALLGSIDVPAPVERVRERLAARGAEAARPVRRAWLGRSDLARAALLLLAFSGCWSANARPNRSPRPSSRGPCPRRRARSAYASRSLGRGRG
jgi:anti-sigma factor RsiW